MEKEEFQYGVPSMLLLPANNYKFKVSKEVYSIILPRSGVYYDIDPKFFSKDDGEFNLYDEDSKTMWLPAITKVLFATRKYPDLKSNQFFCPISLKFNDAEVELLGQIVETYKQDE